METERALFFALAEVHTGLLEHGEYYSVGLNLTKPSSQTKTELVQSWSESPLENRNDARSWFLARQHNLENNTISSSHLLAEKTIDQSSMPPMPTRSLEHESWPGDMSMGMPPPRNNPDSPKDPGFPPGMQADKSWGGFDMDAPNLHMVMTTGGQTIYNPQGSPSTPSDTRSIATQHPSWTRGSAQQGRASDFAKENQNIYF